ncbi:MAG: PEGA domain-containing protein [Myxococcales bacterium]|nr:PEGA domain-containing protein [Myxococcales bacterium]
MKLLGGWNRIFKTSACLLATLSLGLVSPQAATAKPRVAILPYQTTSSLEAARVGVLKLYFRKAMKAQSRMELLSKKFVLDKLNNVKEMSSETRAQIERFQGYVDKGKKLCAIGQARFGKFALKALSKAEELVPDLQHEMTDPQKMTNFYLYTALAHFVSKDKDEAKTYLKKTLQFNPSLQRLGDAFPAAFVDFFGEIRKSVTESAQYSLTLGSKPAGGRVYYNHRYVGKTPVTISNIPLGRHLLRIELDGFNRWSTIANFNRDKLGNRRSLKTTVPLSRDAQALNIDGIPMFASSAGEDPIVLDRLESISNRLNANYLFIASPENIKLKNGDTISVLRIATYRKGAKRIAYKNLRVGDSNDEGRRVIYNYVKKLARFIAR